MKIQYLSDIHLEYYRDKGEYFFKSLPKTGDVLVLAGDIFTKNSICPTVIRTLSSKYSHIIYVAGNHEFWGSTVFETYIYLYESTKDIRNFHWLDQSSVNCDGVVFAGTTMWWGDTPSARCKTNRWSDFNRIGDFRDYVWRTIKENNNFLNKSKADVIVTHYLPSYMSVGAKYIGDIYNCYFVNDQEKVIMKNRPKIWIHGHTHDSCEYEIGSTTILCNPVGNLSDLNSGYEEGKVIEVFPT